MIRICLTVIFSYLSFLCAFGQVPDSSYHSRALHVDEINLVSSMYSQDGNNSAVTGGLGTEKLTDFSNSLELKLSRYDNKERLHSISLGIGVDAYTSASSDQIDPSAFTHASATDTRIYPSLNWKVTNTKKRRAIEGLASFSTEYDYTSFALGAGYSKTSRDENREFGLKVTAFADTWKVVLPIELRTPGVGPASEPRKSLNLMTSLSQVINRRLMVGVILEPSWQQGLLATRFQRVYFNDLSVHSENLPDTRWKMAAAVRGHYFLGDRIVLRGFYRYYTDQWQLQAHTFMLETPIRVAYITFSPFYRYYTQQGISYFAPLNAHSASERFFTSDYDLSDLSAQSAGAGLRFNPMRGVFHMPMWNSIELRYEHYQRSTALSADIVTLALRFTPDVDLKSVFRKRK